MTHVRPHVLLAVALALVAPAAPAQIGLFDWTLQGAESGAGTVTPTALLVTGPDGACSVPIAYFGTIAPFAGTLSVTVEFQNLDTGGAQGHFDYDAPAAWHQGRIILAEDDPLLGGWPSGTYTLSVAVEAGDEFGFGVWSLDCIEGPGVAEIHSLEYTPVPWSEQPGGLDPRVRFTVPGQPSFGKAVSVAGVGDVNGDGVPDLVLGSNGEAVVRTGSTGKILRVLDGFGGATFGAAVAGAGDVDGDGHDDVVVGSPNDSESPLFNNGTAWVFSGDDGALLHELHGTADWDRLGSAVAGVGDVDADGSDDVAISIASVFDTFLQRVLVVSGATGATLHTFTTPGPFLDFGHSVAGVGDTDGDGHDDVAVATNLGTRVYSGDTGTVLHVLGRNYGDRPDVDGAGDVDGDGFDDIVVAGWRYLVVGEYTGRVGIFSGLTGAPLTTITGTTPDVRFAWRARGGADLDGDGRLDVAVSAPDVAPGGLVEVYDALDGTLRGSYAAADEGDGLGEELDRVGDLDGDGQQDVAVLAPQTGVTPLGYVRALQHLDRTGAPELVGTGTLLPGDPFQLTLSNALPGAAVWFLGGTEYVGASFLGGVLGPLPTVFIPGAADGAGGLVLASTWPAGLTPGLTIWVQAWTADPEAPQGYAGTQTLGATNF